MPTENPNSGPPYRDYLPADSQSSTTTTSSPLEKPRPGRGTVYLMELPDGSWQGAWEDENRIEYFEDQNQKSVIAWAEKVIAPAKKIFDRTLDDYVDLPSMSA